LRFIVWSFLKARLQFILDQIKRGNVTDLEDYAKDDWIITNKKFVHIPEKVQETKITAKTLKDATFDLVKINLHLLLLSVGEDREPLEKAVEHILSAAWHYKQPAPDRASRKNRKEPRKRFPQPKASQP
jgi:hypothetical protein